MQRLSFLVLVLSFSLRAQLPTRPFVEAAGSATVYAAPDQATIDATVSTNGSSAQDAAAKNANQVTVLLAALGKLLGSGANIKTAYYSVYPVYQYPAATIAGYQANSTVEVTLGDLSTAGAVIDTAVGSGATSIGGINFSLKDPEPLRQQALRTATQQALAHANAMATGAGHTVGNVRSVQEGSIIQITPIYGAGAGGGGGGGGGVPTPVQPGTIQVQETVTITADLN
jgi:uncharacterized protein YggE